MNLLTHGTFLNRANTLNLRKAIGSKLLTVFLATMILFTGLYLIVRSTALWFDNNRLVFTRPVEIKFNTPLRVEARTVQQVVMPVVIGNVNLVSEHLTKEDKVAIVKASRLSGLTDGIWSLETNRGDAPQGHHKYCESLGMTNEFGYGALDKVCFTTFQESVDTVTKWLEKNLENKPISETLCFYNKGTDERDCEYYISWRALNQ